MKDKPLDATPGPEFKWEVTRSDEYGTSIYLRQRSKREYQGELSFGIRRMKKLDPKVYGHHVDDPYPYPFADYLKTLKQKDDEASKLAVKSFETKPSVVAYVSMWQIKDDARGNLAVVRQMFKTLLPILQKQHVEYVVGRYVEQEEEGLSIAPYAAEMYQRIAEASGGEVHSNGNVWVSVEGLAKWLESKRDI